MTQPCCPAWFTMLFRRGALFSRMLALPLSRVARSPSVMLLLFWLLLLLLLLLLLENLVDCWLLMESRHDIDIRSSSSDVRSLKTHPRDDWTGPGCRGRPLLPPPAGKRCLAPPEPGRSGLTSGLQETAGTAEVEQWWRGWWLSWELAWNCQKYHHWSLQSVLPGEHGCCDDVRHLLITVILNTIKSLCSNQSHKQRGVLPLIKTGLTLK